MPRRKELWGGALVASLGIIATISPISLPIIVRIGLWVVFIEACAFWLLSFLPVIHRLRNGRKAIKPMTLLAVAIFGAIVGAVSAPLIWLLLPADRPVVTPQSATAAADKADSPPKDDGKIVPSTPQPNLPMATQPSSTTALIAKEEQVSGSIRGDVGKPALERLAVREKSAAEVLGNLKGVIGTYEYDGKVKALYVGRWTREPGWLARVQKLPSQLGDSWNCNFEETGSGTPIFAATAEDLSSIRPGDSVMINGRISEVTPDCVYLDHAVVTENPKQ